MSHFHLVVNGSKVSADQAVAIARALETLLVFDLILQDPHPTESIAPINEHSTFELKKSEQS